jgi:hypothetical protein
MMPGGRVACSPARPRLPTTSRGGSPEDADPAHRAGSAKAQLLHVNRISPIAGLSLPAAAPKYG